MASVTISQKLNILKTLKPYCYGIFNIKPSKQVVIIKNIRDFRISFINDNLPSYNINNGAPIGVAVIGINDYIL